MLSDKFRKQLDDACVTALKLGLNDGYKWTKHINDAFRRVHRSMRAEESSVITSARKQVLDDEQAWIAEASKLPKPSSEWKKLRTFLGDKVYSRLYVTPEKESTHQHLRPSVAADEMTRVFYENITETFKLLACSLADFGEDSEQFIKYKKLLENDAKEWYQYFASYGG